MAKKEDPRPTGKSKMTVMFFQLEGNDDTVQEGPRKISESLTSAFGNQGRVLKTIAGGIPGSANPKGSKISEDVEFEGDEVNAASESDDTSLEQDEPPAVASTPRRRTVEKAPNVVDIDVSQAKRPLADLFAAKNPDDTLPTQLLVAAYWMKHEAKIAEFSVDEIYTLLRQLDKIVPSPRKLIKNMLQRRLLNSGTKLGYYTLNSVSEAKVQKMPAG